MERYYNMCRLSALNLNFIVGEIFISYHDSSDTCCFAGAAKTFFLFLCLAGVQDADLSVLSQTMAQCCKNIKETVQMLASRHKDIHGSVSKVGKAIDRVRTGSFFP